MKKAKRLLFLILLMIVFHHYGFGQIKINDGSYKSNTEGFKEVKTIQSIYTYDQLFKADAIARINIREQYNSSGTRLIFNPIGENVYVDNGHENRLCLNPSKMTASITKIPDGYYTIVGWFGRYKGVDEEGLVGYTKSENAKIIRAHIEMLNNYTFDNELNHYKAITLFYNPSISTNENWHYDKGVLKDYRGQTVNEPKPSDDELVRFVNIQGKGYYILEDNEGNKYYDFRDRYDDCCRDLFFGGDEYNKDFGHYGPPERFISTKCFNKISELILNKEVVVGYKIEVDYLTEDKINVSEGTVCFCNDLFLHEGHLVAVLSNEHGEFTVQIYGYANSEFEPIGYRGVAGLTEPYNRNERIDSQSRYTGAMKNGYGSIYPKSYLELIKEGKQKQAEELAAEKQRMEQEAERKRQEHRNNIIAKYGEKWGTLILEHKVAVGMTKEMCKAAIGYPSNTYTKTTEKGNCEVLVYSNSITIRWLYFYDGILYMIESAD